MSSNLNIAGPRALKNPRSKEYAEQTVRCLKTYVESEKFHEKLVEKELDVIKEYRHWEVLGYASMDELLVSRVGLSLVQIRAAQALAADPKIEPSPTLSEAMVGNQNAVKKDGAFIAKNSDANGTAVPKKGSNNAEYLVRRLKRDAPEIAAKLASGEIKSARAAGIAAGIVKVKTVVEQALSLVKKMSSDELKDFLAKVKDIENGK